ncbi:hypothetical protein BK816_03510 [Boudabousia tangfeifanii]|uniref:Uncharacterized protein n=1 Tax=Boudabousia tangfeifanii TaxID=1912795 RepID=A0A1D9MJL5_9ACTO|nr:hypothetical protein [Boudabousia tangfeifanii]AOZ72476.1 hypothetical protein BK816_03510 [Boudabousia tangfeifanii]
MRIYIPVAPQDLAADAVNAKLVFALTPKLLELADEIGYNESEAEELAATYAAQASAEFDENAAIGRRIVLAASTEEAKLRNLDKEGYASAETDLSLPWKKIDAILMDLPGVETLVKRLHEADEDAWDELAELSLAWFDPSERTALQTELGLN